MLVKHSQMKSQPGNLAYQELSLVSTPTPCLVILSKNTRTPQSWGSIYRPLPSVIVVARWKGPGEEHKNDEC